MYRYEASVERSAHLSIPLRAQTVLPNRLTGLFITLTRPLFNLVPLCRRSFVETSIHWTGASGTGLHFPRVD